MRNTPSRAPALSASRKLDRGLLVRTACQGRLLFVTYSHSSVACHIVTHQRGMAPPCAIHTGALRTQVAQ